MSNYHLAQINIARFHLPIENPANLGFMDALDKVNAVAEQQDGFIWRLVGEGNSATDISAYEDPQIVINMSVWRDRDALAKFVYRTPDHVEIMRQRDIWFGKIDTYLVLWWVPIGHEPTIEEGQARLKMLAEKGPTPQAFTFKENFPQPD